MQLAYFTYGTKDVLERECINLHQKLKVQFYSTDSGEYDISFIYVVIDPSLAYVFILYFTLTFCYCLNIDGKFSLLKARTICTSLSLII